MRKWNEIRIFKNFFKKLEQAISLRISKAWGITIAYLLSGPLIEPTGVSQHQHVVRCIWYISPRRWKETARSAHFVNNCLSQKNLIQQQFLACPLQAKQPTWMLPKTDLDARMFWYKRKVRFNKRNQQGWIMFFRTVDSWQMRYNYRSLRCPHSNRHSVQRFVVKLERDSKFPRILAHAQIFYIASEQCLTILTNQI